MECRSSRETEIKCNGVEMSEECVYMYKVRNEKVKGVLVLQMSWLVEQNAIC